MSQTAPPATCANCLHSRTIPNQTTTLLCQLNPPIPVRSTSDRHPTGIRSQYNIRWMQPHVADTALCSHHQPRTENAEEGSQP